MMFNHEKITTHASRDPPRVVRKASKEKVLNY